ncbi:MAG: gamma-glutamyltransferase [Gammaproteobacteria bacterium]|nr:gamma-glutamyltransferase [Gammaproteobacteria bacterium]MBV9697180.1 gamma-glutamyltransferase [Gammaproteobacteria bacterium]
MRSGAALCLLAALLWGGAAHARLQPAENPPEPPASASEPAPSQAQEAPPAPASGPAPSQPQEAPHAPAPEAPEAPAVAPPGAPVLPLHRVPRRARQAWVAAANPLAVDAGIEILGQGGKAIDAAVAVQAMLGLVEPQSSGVGGGAFLVYYDASSGKVLSIDGRETAPALAKPDMFLDEHGRPLSHVEAIRSGRSTGVPGAISMLYTAHAKLGALPWKELFEPAIRAATRGFRVSARLAMFLGEGSPFPPTNEIRTLFSRADGETLQEGDAFANPEYARTLQRIATEGYRGLYQGPIAQAIVTATQQSPLPGTMTLKDLAGYRSRWSDPLCRPYRGFTVCVPPPPSSGVSLLQMLALLEQTDIARRGPNDPQAWFLFAQASRLMYADRDRYVADPRFVHVPVARLLDPRYLKQRAQLIGVRAGAPPPAGDIPVPRGHDATNEAAGTSHFVIVDADGNVASITTTVESVFGSGRTAGGFVLNNQLTDFSFVPSEGGVPVANAVHGGKQPRSSMAPVIVLDPAGNFVAALGSPGGSAILDYNAKTLVALLAWHLSLKQAIELPNLIARGDTFTGEMDRFAPALVAGLRERGIELKSGHAENSGLHAVLRHPDGSYEAAADSRREGVARMIVPAQAHGRHAAAAAH